MIKISFPQPRTTEWKSWRQKCNNEQFALNYSHSCGQPKAVSQKLYAELKDVYLRVDKPFYGKCAYCESFIAENQPGDLDHFRPKQAVTHHTQPVTIKDADGHETPHPGYYWLTYDYQNLLPACADCNRPSKRKTQGIHIGKGAEFPVQTFRACRPGEEIHEQPLLINPVTDDDIEQHMEVQASGLIKPLTIQGETCCKIFGLNTREALITRRQEEYQKGFDALINWVTAKLKHDHREAKLNNKIIQEFRLGKRPYSAAGRAGIKAARVWIESTTASLPS
jgi:hypothetical protein